MAARLREAGVFAAVAEELARTVSAVQIEACLAAWRPEEARSPGALVWRIRNQPAAPPVAAADPWLEHRRQQMEAKMRVVGA